MNYRYNCPTDEELKQWNNNKLINPRTNRKILENGPTYNLLEKYLNKNFTKDTNGIKLDISNYKCVQKLDKAILEEIFNIIDNIYIKLPNSDDDIYCDSSDNYKKFRINKIDPFTFEKVNVKTAFTFPWKWNPYSGKRTDEIDENGPLYFNPDNLIYFYYSNRLNNLWNYQSDDQNGHYHGYYGNAVGMGPDFNIKSRGCYYEWYLFRLPIIDCYFNKYHNEQYITMGPILTDDEIKTIYNLAEKNKLNYKTNNKKQRPNIIKMKELYEKAINKEPYLGFDKELEPHLDTDDLIARRCKENRDNVDKLVNFY